MFVDDPSDRVDKAVGANVKTKNVFTLAPTALSTLRPQTIFLLQQQKIFRFKLKFVPNKLTFFFMSVKFKH
jgi:hypothetical protein